MTTDTIPVYICISFHIYACKNCWQLMRSFRSSYFFIISMRWWMLNFLQLSFHDIYKSNHYAVYLKVSSNISIVSQKNKQQTWKKTWLNQLAYWPPSLPVRVNAELWTGFLGLEAFSYWTTTRACRLDFKSKHPVTPRGWARGWSWSRAQHTKQRPCDILDCPWSWFELNFAICHIKIWPTR